MPCRTIDILLDRNLQRASICGVRAGGGRGCDGFCRLWEVGGEGGIGRIWRVGWLFNVV